MSRKKRWDIKVKVFLLFRKMDFSSTGERIYFRGRTLPPFTEPSFKSCILGGVDPAGNPLNTMMPKWEMSSEDLDSLIEYLKTI